MTYLSAVHISWRLTALTLLISHVTPNGSGAFRNALQDLTVKRTHRGTGAFE